MCGQDRECSSLPDSPRDRKGYLESLKNCVSLLQRENLVVLSWWWGGRCDVIFLGALQVAFDAQEKCMPNQV